jgi:cell wall-active antibiotic response 4TMS protein YvqF
MSSDARIIGYCRMCGKALEESDATAAEGTLYCAEHAPQAAASTEGAAPPPLGQQQPPPLYTASSPYAASQPPPLPRGDEHVSPPLAFVLGFIPGVGAVYNGQYAKGLLHVVIFGSIISILSSGAAQGFVPLFGLMIPTFVFYMAFEAYHTAKKRRDGEMVDEFSGLVRARGERPRFPLAPVLLIGFGILFLLDNLDLLRIGRLLRYWPAVLIVLGLYLLYERIAESKYESKQ